VKHFVLNLIDGGIQSKQIALLHLHPPNGHFIDIKKLGFFLCQRVQVLFLLNQQLLFLGVRSFGFLLNGFSVIQYFF